ncbi:MAG: hypothetical protein A2808_03205 [Candidatus Moranbacteria bacterium RIFCSPHIGHO2_01_FULL_55_24]|nr:MAG: hypothetical protein A2808_03205 [Candidatus Moranbacteria bacterium RIFCSPHIGHO2_01_FULL_55_24]
MLTLKEIRKTLGGQRVLNKISFSIGEGQRVALVGQNGVGKSTLLRIIAGLEDADRGEILLPNRVLKGYLPQEALATADETLGSYLRRMAGLEALEQEMKVLEGKLENPEAMEQYETLMGEYRRLGGYDFERRMQKVVEGLRLHTVGPERLVSELSGGERRKAALAGVLLRGVDLLLLDEPTNNLDLPALLWLEKYLVQSGATCLIASHDRSFLDHVVEKVIEIDWIKREAKMYTGNWSTYSEMKAHAFRRHKEEYRRQEEERERLTESKVQKKEWADRVWDRKVYDLDKMAAHFKKERASKKFHASAKAIEGREKRLRTVETPLERAPLMIDLGIPEESEAKDLLVQAEELRFGYPSGFSGGPVSFAIPFGSRIALLGDNGAGKTTLLKTLTGQLAPLGGTLTVGGLVKFGYLVQEHEELIRDEKIKVREFFKRRLKGFDHDELPKRFQDFQLPLTLLDTRLSQVSPGERVRMLVLLLVLQQVNVLVLDEPTNHLDLEAIEALEESTNAFPGTLLLVTHDRRFLENVRLDEHYLLQEGQLARLPGKDILEQTL